MGNDDEDDDDDTNPWKNPNDMFQQLDMARTQVMEAARILKEAVAKGGDKNEATSSTTTPDYDEDYLKAQFMDMITDSFADVLQEMKETEEVDVDILADCLQSGMDLLSEEDRELFLQDLNDDDHDDDEEEEKLTPHEQRRRRLGFLPSGETTTKDS